MNVDHVSTIRPYDERRLSVRFADDSEVVASRASSQSLREMVRTSLSSVAAIPTLQKDQRLEGVLTSITA